MIRISDEEEDTSRYNFFNAMKSNKAIETSPGPIDGDKVITKEAADGDKASSKTFFSKLTYSSVNKDPEPVKRSLFTGTDDYDQEIKAATKIKIGYYRLSSENKVVRYVYVPSALASQANFNVDDVFQALGIPTPNLMFDINSSDDALHWNLRLPSYKTNLIGLRHPNARAEDPSLNGQLAHYQGVVRENCKRLLRGTGLACHQAGAVFKVENQYAHYEYDYVSEWLAEITSVPMIGIAAFHHYHKDIIYKLIDNSHNFNPNTTVEDEEELKKVLRIDTKPWLDGTIQAKTNGKNVDEEGLPFLKMSHLILSDDINSIGEKIEKAIPTGLIVIHGGINTTRLFCNAVQKGNPIFLFKYTGSTADLACEMLSKVDQFLQRKRLNPSARPEPPFKTDLPLNYSHPRWLHPFGRENIECCKQLNILIENFPDRYNPSSILRIDMFNTSEEKLQDQLTKTMSVVFEGVVELGGASAESRRLTYAWRLRHLLSYNAKRQKWLANILQAFIILFSLISTIAAVTYTYYAQVTGISLIGNSGGSMFSATGSPMQVLLTLNLLLPLAVTILRGFYANLNPMAKYGVLKMGAIRVETEIYMYRTKVGRYNMRKVPTQQNGSNNNKNQSKKEDKDDSAPVITNPRKLFSQSLDSIWLDLASSDISKGALRNPPEGTDPLDDINVRILSNKREQQLLTQNLKQPLASQKKMNKSKSSGKGASMFSLLSPTKAKSPQPQSPTNLSEMSLADIYGDAESEADDSHSLQLSPLGKTSTKGDDRDDREDESASVSGVSNLGSQINAADVELGNENLQGNERKEEAVDELFDDGLTSLTADEYVKLRLMPLIASFTAKAPPMASLATVVTLVTIFLSVTSSVLTTYHLVIFIPIAMAFSSSLMAWTSYLQVELRLIQTNGAVHVLHQLMIWWDSLSMIEKRVAQNKEFLVVTTENAVQGQVVGYVATGKNQDSDNDDDKNY